ncbi:MAG TPA: DUF427 domain-containing protein [Actinomycetota bacterium]|nr:DUF427 domain-containing protein [Actinomycetota bacterium]
MRVDRIEPGPGQRSVWDHPRPPAIERDERHVVVTFVGETIADTRRAIKILETSHPPTWYLPLADVRRGFLRPGLGGSFCEWKGQASYLDVVVGDRVSADAAWFYPRPSPRYAALVDHVAFYAGRVDRVTVDGAIVVPQAGGFYGGWITDDVVGPFKGAPGTRGW